MQSRHNATTSRSAEMQKLRFPQKLWIIVNDSNGIAEWSRNGAAICLDIDALDAYLLSDDSIFRTRNHCSFERQMLLYGFQRLGGHTLISGRASFATMEPDEMEFRHECFKRDRPNMIDSIRKRLISNDRNFKILRMPQTVMRQRLRPHSDPCRRLLASAGSGKTPLTREQLNYARLRLRTILRERSVRAMLSLKLDKCVRTNNWSIELDADVFENAVDSVSGFEQRDVAGYYGQSVTSEQIKSFFGEYLPTYSNEDGIPSSSASQPNDPAESLAFADDSFSIPQFHIVANPQANDLNAYSLQLVNEGEPKNNLTPIHYDTSFLDETNNSSTFADRIKEEFTAMHDQLVQPELDDDEDDDNFEIDHFFRIKPKVADHPDQHDDTSMDQNDAIKIEANGVKCGAPTEQTMSAALDENSTSTECSNSSSTESRQISDANDIIQQAAIIDDDFFSQIRESMDVLYDKILC